MRIYVDACIDPRVAELLADHDVSTAVELRWHKLLDREIVARCNGRFDVLLTMDRGFEYEHNLSKLQFGIIIVHVPKNKVAFFRPLRAAFSPPWITSLRGASSTFAETGSPSTIGVY